MNLKSKSSNKKEKNLFYNSKLINLKEEPSQKEMNS